MNISVAFEELKGQTLLRVEVDKDKNQIVFETKEGIVYTMLHNQDCCESVTI